MNRTVDDTLFRRVMEQATMALVAVENDGTIIYVNQALRTLLDYPEGLIGQPVEVLIPARVKSAHLGYREHFFAHPSQRPMGKGHHLVALSRTGREIPVEIGLYPVETPEGLLVAAVLTDITDRLHQQEINERHDRLEAVGFLAGGLAHDYNNVLAGILGNVDLLAATVDLDAAGKERVETVRRLVSKGAQIARRLITFSRGGVPVAAPQNLIPLIREAAETTVSGTEVAVRCLFSSSPLISRVDPGQFSQVVTNLVINAYQAMEGPGTVLLSGGLIEITPDDPTFGVPPGRYIHLAVHDDGPGIPPEVQSKVFDPFFTTKAQGSGLGLAIVHSVVTQHGGAVVLHSSADLGTTFELVLPADASLIVNDGFSPASSSGVSCPDPGSVLVMDDNKDLRDSIAAALEQCGLEVTACRHGDEALGQIQLAAAEGRPFGAIILDMTIPGHLGGIDVVRALAHQGVQLPTILMSGYTEADVAATLGTEVQAYLHKPFGLTDLIREVKRLLDA